MSLAPGTRLGPYEVQAALGAGGMGEVYRARDLRIRRSVAIKVLKASRRGEDQLHRLQKEARAVGALNHPNIVALYDVGQHDGLSYVVCELLEGQTLREHVRTGALRVRKALEYAIQIADALAAAHGRGIQHGDLTPGNVFVTTEGRVKLLDFGLARSFAVDAAAEGSVSTHTGPLTLPGMIAGTPGYMAPEQIEGHSTDHRADLFSFGAVLYHTLTGSPAFTGRTLVDTLTATLKNDAPPLSNEGRHVPAGVDEIVRHCLEKNPSERFQSANDLAFDLRRALTSLDAAVPAPARRIALWMRAALVALPVILLGAAAALWLQRDTQVPAFSRVTFNRGTIVNARFAPHEQAIVHTAAWDGNAMDVYLSLPNAPEPRSLEHAGARLLAISNGGEMALAVRLRHAGAERYLGRLVTMPWSGGSGREILENVEYADWSRNGELAVVRFEESSSESRLEYPIGTALYVSTAAIRNPRVSPDGNSVAFLDDPTGLGLEAAVAVVEKSGRRTVLTRQHQDARGLAWAPEGREIWFTAEAQGGRALHAVTPAGAERVVARVPGSLTLQDIAGDGRVLVTREDERSGIRARAPGEADERELSWLDDSGLADLTPDGTMVLFGDRTRVFLRRTDGSAPARLGEGYADALSPDGKWALTTTTARDRLVVTPTGAGQPRALDRHDETSYGGAAWFPDGKRILFNGRAPGIALRCYVRHLETNEVRALTPEGRWCLSVSPDGRFVAAIGQDTGIWLHEANGGRAEAVPGSEPGDRPGGWSADGSSLWVFRRGEVPACIHRLNVTTGRRTPLKCVVPRDATGVTSITDIRVTPDGRSYAYSYRRVLSELYVVTGLD